MPASPHKCGSTPSYRKGRGGNRLFRGLPGGPYALGQHRREIGHRVNRFGRRLALGIEAGAKRIDQRRADHGAVGACSDARAPVRGADAEADADRQAACGA